LIVKEPFLKDDAFLQSVDAARSSAGPPDARTSLTLWWLGQSGFLLQANGHSLLLDPYLSDSLTRKYASTDKPHVRMTARVVAPDRLDFVELVTSSHNHTDHLDPETLKPLAGVNPGLVMVCPEANRTTVRERSGLPDNRILGLDHPSFPSNPALETRFNGLRITAVPAAHEALDRDPAGRALYLGYVIELGPFRVYHSGDTVLYPGLVDLLRPFRIDVALLPINGRAPERRVAGNLSGPEAAQLASEIRARLVIPCHYEMFEFNTASPDAFVRTCAELGQPFCVARQGEPVTLEALPAAGRGVGPSVGVPP
jgi:L-ascorbate metabolism protein UlaG (beta-lactamase superfamily)